jgi:starvation-inducible DNA-binding protein
MIFRYDRLGIEVSAGEPNSTGAETVAHELQHVLETLIDLALIGKHAHWNVVGPNFRALHLQLDELIDAWRDAADAVGERMAAVGGFPDGRVETVAAGRELPTLTEGPQRDRALVTSLSTILNAAVNLTRPRMDRIEYLDPVTADLLHSVVGTLEEQLWMMRAQAAG